MKYLLSDWCGVWVHQFFPRYTRNTHSLLTKWGAETNIQEYRRFMKFYERDYLRGDVSGQEFWYYVMKHHGVTSSETRLKSLIDAFIEAFVPNDEFIEWVEKNRDGLTIGILSNTYAEVKPLILRYDGDFDFAVLSCDHGALKPDDLIYRVAFSRFQEINPGLKKSDILFIDDKQRNIDAARRYGFRALLYENPDALEIAISEQVNNA